MGLNVDKLKVDLVEHDLFAAFLVHDGIEATGERQVCTDFLTGFLTGFFRCISRLGSEFCAEFATFFSIRNKIHLAGVDESAFHILDEGFHVDVFVALVADTADDDGREFTVLRVQKLIVPWTSNAVLDHFFCNETGVCIVPFTGKIGHGFGFDTGDFFTAAGASDESGHSSHEHKKAKNFRHIYPLLNCEFRGKYSKAFLLKRKMTLYPRRRQFLAVH